MVAVDLPSEGAAGEVDRQKGGPPHVSSGEDESGAASPVHVGQDDHAKADDTTAATPPGVDVPEEKELSGSENSSHFPPGTHLGNSVALRPSRRTQHSSHFGCFAVHRKSAAILFRWIQGEQVCHEIFHERLTNAALAKHNFYLSVFEAHRLLYHSA